MSRSILAGLPGDFDQRFVTLGPETRGLAGSIRSAAHTIGNLAHPSLTRVKVAEARKVIADLPAMLDALDTALDQEAAPPPAEPS